MATRTPKVVIGNLQLTTTLTDTSYTVPANTVLTISAATLNNTTATPRTATINVIPNGGSAGATTQIATTLAVPAAGAAPTIVAGLVGQHIEAGGKLQAIADAGSAVTILVSGYLTA